MKVLVAVDLSPSSRLVVEYASQLVIQLAAPVWVLHVAEPDPEFVGYDVGPQSERDAVANKLHQEHKQTQDYADELRSAGVDATALVIQGAMVEVIVGQARKLDVDMIVIGSHGRGAMHQLLVGSVSEGVLKKSSCPVVVVPTR